MYCLLVQHFHAVVYYIVSDKFDRYTSTLGTNMGVKWV